MMRGRFGQRKEWLAGAFLLTLTLINVASVCKLAPMLRKGYQDFTAFYGAAKMVRDGQIARLYDLDALYQVEKQFAPEVPIRQAALPYNHTPFEVLVWLPFAYLNYLPAYVAWTVFNIVLLILSLRMVRSRFPEVGEFSLIFLLLAVGAFVPVVIALMQGQDPILLVFAFTLGLTLLEEGRDVAAGAALGLGLFKFHFVIPLALILSVRRPRVLLGIIPVGAMWILVSALMVGWGGLVEFVQFSWRLEKSGAGGAISSVGMPNLRGLIAELPGIVGGSVFAVSLTMVCSVVVMGVAAWVVARSEVPVSCLFAVASVASILVSYHAIIHDVAWLVVVVLLLFCAPGGGTRSEMRIDVILLMVVYAIFLSSSRWPWVAPLWSVPVVIWILRKYRHDYAAEAAV
jgi:hypothetical protein